MENTIDPGRGFAFFRAALRAAAGVFVVAALLPAVTPAAPLEIPGFRTGQGQSYAQTTWATVHADSSNSDWVPLVTSPKLEQQWRVLEGAAIWTAPSVAIDGTLYSTTGRGRGSSHLHAISPEGEILWESASQQSLDDLDAGAVTSAPLLDDNGDVYVGDANQFWAFRADGRVKWVSDVAALGVEGPFVSSILVGGFVGGISVNGQVMLLERETGALAVPVLELPGGPSPEGPGVPDWVWAGGLMDPDTKERVLEILMGHRYEVSNTPAVHPESGRIYIMAAGRSLEEGLFYGIDLVEGALHIAFETPVAPGSGTSPAISPDGERVYAFGGGGEVMGFDARTGAVVFDKDLGGTPASPSVGPDGAVYILARSRLLKIDGRSGEVIWSRSYDDFAAEKITAVSWLWPFVTTGKPGAFLDSVVTVTPKLIWTSLLLGYELDVFGRDLVSAKRTFLVAIDPGSGDLVAHYPIPDTSEGGISVGKHGELYLDILAVQSSLAAGAPYRWLLPGSLGVEPSRGGLVAFAPASQRDQAAWGIAWAAELLDEAAGPLKAGEREGVRDLMVLARSQLRASGESIVLARKQGEVKGFESEPALRTVERALSAVETCLAALRARRSCRALGPYASRLAELAAGWPE
ncbi:MAG: PQQ-like beta-propeller repeat protein [Deltaproteobacteria bacterium]|nr:PQQ-like beta-propeller repeat protein [Deltaproteobacteria bacterium]